ncbi:MAG: cyclic nucleotide-binding domain-containing protein [Bacteroidales bacterium]|jgi:CRP-like cAMP-binding protein|nr:cyclic nucleotide-binding domain-containing protein [Bacteroidales bacterium]
MDEMLIETTKRAELLSRISVFSALSTQALTELASALQEHKFKAQELVFRKGDQGENMFILAEGEVRVHDGNHVIARLKAGEVFGEYALFDTENRSASVTTESQCIVLVLNRSTLMIFLKDYPELLTGMLQLQIKRMRDMNDLEEKLSKSYLKISKQKQEIEAQNEAIKDQKAQLVIQNESLEELNNQKKQLLSVIIHGLKNPMTSVKSMAEMIDSSNDLHPDVKEYASILLHAVGRMDMVINDLIRTNQASEFQEGKALQRFDWSALIQSLANEKTMAFEERNLKLNLPSSAQMLNKNQTLVQLITEQLLSWILIFADQDQTVELSILTLESKFALQISFIPKLKIESLLEKNTLSWWQLLVLVEGEQFEKFSFSKRLFDDANADLSFACRHKLMTIELTLN